MLNKTEVLATVAKYLDGARPTKAEYDALEDSILESKFIIRIFGSWTRFLSLLAEEVEPLIVKKDMSSTEVKTSTPVDKSTTVAVKDVKDDKTA